MAVTLFMLVFSVLLFVSVFAGKAGSRFGIPSLLLFLGIGMLFGSDGFGIPFDNAYAAQIIGTVALSIILFTGGMETKYSEIRPIAAPGVILASLGVLMTAFLTGGFIYIICQLFGFHLSLLESFLMASVMSSTDSASVFSILRSKRQGLQQNLRPLLELESGSNDPMAYILTITLLSIISQGSNPNWWLVSGNFVMQMAIGALAGYLLGRFTVWAINRLNIGNASLNGIALLAMVFFTFALTDTINGNGYLAVYIAGLVVGNKKIVFKKSLTNFMDGFTWLFQIMMFLALGLLVSPHRLFQPQTALLGLLVGVFMIVFARPLSVIACMAPFKQFTTKARAYVSWVGLRGAVPIIFATYPLVAVESGFDPEVAGLIFNVVFFITILSLLIQGSTVSLMAKKLGLSKELPEDSFGVDLPENLKSALAEIEVTAAFISKGEHLRDISLPPNTLVVMVKREEDFFVPRGDTALRIGDRLLVVADRDGDDVLLQELEQVGIESEPEQDSETESDSEE